MAVVPDEREPHVIAGTPIVLDPAGPLYTPLSGSLRPYVQGQDDRGGTALGN